MPRSIYQRNERTYIGDDIFQAAGSGTYGPVSTLITYYSRLLVGYATYQEMADNPLEADAWTDTLPVLDREDNNWIRLNVGDLMVDYRVTDVRHDKATVTWETNYDYQKIWILLNAPGVREQKIERNPQTLQTVVGGLTADTVYEINVIAELPWGATLSNRQVFRTRDKTVFTPTAPSGLKYTKRTNSSITLTWNSAQYANQYVVYQAERNGARRKVATTIGRTVTLPLKADTRYRFSVRGVSADGVGGPFSGELRSATGHDEKRRRGSVRRLVLPPHRWGSWRSDIDWDWWKTWPDRDANEALYQGYWEYPQKRYWGVIEYDPSQLSAIIDRRFGSRVSDNLKVTEAAVRRIYRQRYPGNMAPQELVWHLTNTKVRAQKAQPTVYGRHVNDRNSADSLAWQRSLAAGKAIEFLRIPRAWGEAIIQGRNGGTNVRGLVLHRGDSQNNGYGYAGYCKISGHKQPDYYLGGGGGRKSDLSLVVSANWNVVTSSYKAPYDW